MTAPPRIGVKERRARLAVRHHLARPARVVSAEDAARGVVALHASDPASVYLSAWARMTDPAVAAVERALYEDRSLVRMLAMRRTMFVVPRDDVPIMHAAASIAIARTERRRNARLLEQLGARDIPGWMRRAEVAALEALNRRGEATAQELAEDVAALRRKVRMSIGKPWEQEIGMSGRILLVLALEGKVMRGRPRGSWTSSQYRWAATSRWLGGAIDDLPVAEAQAAVVRRWLSRFGPGTEADIRWWTGWSAVAVRAALTSIGAISVQLGERAGFILPHDLEPTAPAGPWVALLPALDPTTMGWREREWYLGEYQSRLFDTSGNAGPTIWVNGRIVGGWAMRADGEIVYKLLEDIGRASTRAVEDEAARLTSWLDTTSMIPRFPTPLHRELLEEERGRFVPVGATASPRGTSRRRPDTRAT